MTALNLTIVRDYSLYLALKSSGQGVGEQVRSILPYIGSDYNLYLAFKPSDLGVGEQVR
jgi:hypothetical protein